MVEGVTIQNSIPKWIYEIAIAFVILFIGIVIARIVKKTIQKILEEIELDTVVKSTTKKKSNLQKLLPRIAEFIIYFLAIFLALKYLGIASSIATIIFVSAILIMFVSFILGIKDFFPNIIAGFKLDKDIIRKGNSIIINNTEGKVKHSSLIGLFLKTKSNDTIYFPYSYLIKNKVKKNAKRISQQSKRKD